MTFGETLRTARIKVGYTQDELADKLAVSRSAITKKAINLTQGEEKKQFFVTITDEQIISRALPSKISEKKFEIGNRVFQVVGKVESATL